MIRIPLRHRDSASGLLLPPRLPITRTGIVSAIPRELSAAVNSLADLCELSLRITRSDKSRDDFGQHPGCV